MKILCKNMHMALFALCFGLVLTPESQAKVCFVGDEDCAGSMDFGDYKAPDGATLCDGYTQAPCAEGKHINGYCPYDSSYVICCGPEFVYDDCAYPRIYDGKCGNKYSCTCDLKKFPYTDETCAQAPAENGSEPGNAYPAGGSCTLGVVEGDGKTAQEIYYSACMCDRATYPQPLSKCAVDGNGKPMAGDICRDSEGNEYTTTCKCDWDKFPVVVSECDYGGDGDTCIEGGVTRAEDCCSCEAFPVTLIDGKPKQGGANLQYASDWDVCGCPLGKNRVKITQCAAGWEPTDAGDGCQRIECDKAVKLFFSKPENIKAYKNFAVFDGSSLVTYEQLTDEEKEKLPTKAEQTYAVGDPVTSTTATKGVLPSSVSVPVRACTQSAAGVACTKAEEIYTPSYFANMNSTNVSVDDIVMIKEACAREAPQVITASEYFPNILSTNNKVIKIYGAELYFDGKTNVTYPLELVNTKVTGNGAVFQKPVSLENEGNSGNAVFAMSSSTFNNNLSTNGYSFDGVSSLYLIYDVGFINGRAITPVNFKFNGGETFNVSYLYVTPNQKDKNYNANITINFTAPRSSNGVEVNVKQLRLGYYNDSKFGRNVKAKLTGNISWNMFDENNSTNSIVLSNGSQIYSSDYGSGGYYAKIKFAGGVVAKKCTMADHIKYPHVHLNALNKTDPISSCKPENMQNFTYLTSMEDFVACSVNMNKNISLTKQLIKTYVGSCNAAGSEKEKRCNERRDRWLIKFVGCTTTPRGIGTLANKVSEDWCTTDPYLSCE